MVWDNAPTRHSVACTFWEILTRVEHEANAFTAWHASFACSCATHIDSNKTGSTLDNTHPNFKWTLYSLIKLHFQRSKFQPLPSMTLQCFACDSRTFPSRRALSTHLDTSQKPHPACASCARRFVSESALDAHIIAKHTTFNCVQCEKTLLSQQALDDHYRGSQVHPNCFICGSGCSDEEALEMHFQTTHSTLLCELCKLRFTSERAVQDHYALSPVHPNCKICGVGFFDAESLEQHLLNHHPGPTNHLSDLSAFKSSQSTTQELETPKQATPEMQLITSEQLSPTSTHTVAASQANPQRSYPPSPQGTHISQPVPLQPFTSPRLDTGCSPTLFDNNTGFSPIISKPNPLHKDLRRLGKIDTARTASPDISNLIKSQTQVSPLLNVQAPAFSPIGLPKPDGQIDRLWAARDNVQISPGKRNTLDNTIAQPTIPSSSLAPNYLPSTQQIVPYANHHRQIPPRHALSEMGSRPSTMANFPDSRRSLNTQTNYTFGPRLYPGITRYTALQTSLSPSMGQSLPPLFGGIGNRNFPPVSGVATQSFAPGTVVTRKPSFNMNFSGVQPQPSLLSLPLPPVPPLGGPHQQSTSLDTPAVPQHNYEGSVLGGGRTVWRDVDADASSNEEYSRVATIHEVESGDCQQELSLAKTPMMTTEASLHEFSTPTPQEKSPSDFSSISSVGSSIKKSSSPTPTGTRAISRSRSDSRTRSELSLSSLNLNIPTHGASPQSNSKSPKNYASPDVASPTGLASLPFISPLAYTPVEVDHSFDIPEAQHPLPESIPPTPYNVDGNLDSDSEDVNVLGNVNMDIDAMQIISPPSSDLTQIQEENDSSSTSRTSSVLQNKSSSKDAYVTSTSTTSTPESFTTTSQGFTLDEEEEESQSIEEDKDTIIYEHGHSLRSPSSTLFHIEPEIGNKKAGPGITLKSPSPSPLPITPKDLDSVALSQPRIVSAASESSSKTQLGLPRLVAPSLGITPNVSIASSCASGSGRRIERSNSSSHLPLLHCRSCNTGSPDDITATMCGHVFCNRCIIDAVIKTSRCPFCSTPTLLYCLFRLDLS